MPNPTPGIRAERAPPLVAFAGEVLALAGRERERRRMWWLGGCRPPSPPTPEEVAVGCIVGEREEELERRQIAGKDAGEDAGKGFPKKKNFVIQPIKFCHVAMSLATCAIPVIRNFF